MNALFLVVGALAPHLNGYGSWADFAIGVGVLLGSLVLFAFRRIVQDGEHMQMRDDVPLVPSEAERAELMGTPVTAATQ